MISHDAIGALNDLVNSHRGLFIADLVGAGVMVHGGPPQVFLGVAAERKSLELTATASSAIGATGGPGS